MTTASAASSARPTDDADVIVVGAGHNGLVAAAYLARAGLRVRVFERRGIVGGACVSEELLPGAHFSTCAYVNSSFRPEILADLELEEAHGLEMYTTDVLNFAMNDKHEHLFLWPELDRTLAELHRLSPPDASSFPTFGARFRRFSKLITPHLLTEPPTLGEVIQSFEEAGEIDLWHEFASMSIGGLVDRYFQHDLLRGLFMFFGLVAIDAGPYTPGSAYLFSHLSWGEYKGEFGRFAFVRGGMGGITQALARAAAAAGATIETDAAIEEIDIRQGAVRGVRLMDGRTVSARIVLSNADPKATYERLLPARAVPVEVAAAIKDMDIGGTMGRVHFVLNKLPRYEGFEEGEGPQHRGFTLLGGSPADLQRCAYAQKRGELVDNYPVECIIPSVADREMAPPGAHVMTTGITQLPFELADGTWDTRREEFMGRVVRSLGRFIPDFAETIRDARVLTPLDIEREYGLTGGNIYHGAMTVPQVFNSRPVPKFGGYRTHLQGMYMCGAGTHPGGAVTGAPGHNAAHAVLDDLAGRSRSVRRPRARNRDLTDRLATSAGLRPVRDWALRQPKLRWLVRYLVNR
jgi:phytoene dehydrogenase-like protein